MARVRYTYINLRTRLQRALVNVSAIYATAIHAAFVMHSHNLDTRAEER